MEAETDWHAEQLAGCARGDQACLERLIDREGAWLKGVCIRILKDASAAEDALQEGLLRVWGSAAQYRTTRGSGRGWIYTVVRHSACRAARDRRLECSKTQPWDPDWMEDCADHGSADAASALGRLDGCLEQLGAGRQILEAVVVEGVRYADLAQQHGRPLNTIKTWVRRGLQKLKECMT